MNELLEYLGTVVIPATVENFVAKDKFVVNKGKNASVKISCIRSNFSQWFLGKIEKPETRAVLRYAKLIKLSVGDSILAELGRKDKAENSLTKIYALMEKQGNGESGILLTNGHANIFYVRDTNNALRAVRVRWFDAGWSVHTLSLFSHYLLRAWHDGCRVFSCNS